ncbi:MAG: NnrU family protein, partial [Gammaproteobacteria bacterium]|nr:NnrU family protein [Gammaproteobacteria bacterium]MDX2486848.1 NnrU family protein [Gammaproteobacteria bacterium]
IIVWSIAHILLNGDSRSIILFGSMGLWAALEIIVINRRSGKLEKAAPPAWPREIKGLVISLVIFAM